MRARIASFVRRNAFAIVVVVVAFAVRALYNLFVHPPHEHIYSDMGGYFGRSTEMLDDFWKRSPGQTLFPPATHWLLWLLRRVFGRDAHAPLALAYAAMGALAVALTHAVARRFVADRPDGYDKRWIPRIVAIVVSIHYLWIALGSYYLSEIPFACCLVASALFTLRLADGAPAREGLWLGAAIAIGALFRPQILLSGVLLVVVGLRPRVPKIPWRAVAFAAIPVALALGFASWRYHADTGQFGLVSANGPMNRVFGRCHNTGLRAKAADGDLYFGPTSLRGLRAWGDDGHVVAFPLDPVLGLEIEYQGHLWDRERLDAIAARCEKAASPLRRAKHLFTNVVLLWIYNGMWPDASEGATHERAYIGNASVVSLLFIPTLIALALAFPRSRGRHMLLALHLLALIVTAALYFGDTRFRAPYDGLAIVLAVDVYWLVFATVWRGVQAARAPKLATDQNPSRDAGALVGAGLLTAPVDRGAVGEPPDGATVGKSSTETDVATELGGGAAVAVADGGGTGATGGAVTIDTREGSSDVLAADVVDDEGRGADSQGRK